jgi:UDP-N-acetyl-D-mannosaminuronic acid dehydrogenase
LLIIRGQGLQISIVGGGGRVGLPLGILLASAGNNVFIVDTDQSRVDKINNRILPFQETGADDLLKNLPISQLSATSKNDAILDTEVCILIIGTPVLEDGTPSSIQLVDLVRSLLPFLGNVKLLILRSTVFPGITKQLEKILSENNLLIDLAFCPERIAEGNAIKEIKVLPQIIGVSTDSAFFKATEVFKGVVSETIRTNYEEAEIIKLFANAYRYINFAIANEFFEICLNNHLDWQKVWHGIKHNYPRADALPYPGFAAGPCLTKDTQQLNYYYGNKFELGSTAININERLPNYLISVIRDKYDLKSMTIGILGMTFKANVDDFRSSLSFKLEQLLKQEAKRILCSDVLLQKDDFVDTESLINLSDLIIIATPHNFYRDLVIEKPLVDIWRITKNESIV